MNTQCGTHDNLENILKQNYKDALHAWYENPTHTTMTAVTNASEPFDNLTLRKYAIELQNELAAK